MIAGSLATSKATRSTLACFEGIEGRQALPILATVDIAELSKLWMQLTFGGLSTSQNNALERPLDTLAKDIPSAADVIASTLSTSTDLDFFKTPSSL